MSTTYTTHRLVALLQCQEHFFDLQGNPAFWFGPVNHPVGIPCPWVWFAPTFIDLLPDVHHEWLFSRLLKSGIAVAGVDVGESYGNQAGRTIYTRFHQTLCTAFNAVSRPALLPQSRGSLMLYNWAADHPEKVCCIAGIYPVGDLGNFPFIKEATAAYGLEGEVSTLDLYPYNPIDRLTPLARNNIPIFHVHGDSDQWVPLERHSGEMAARYEQLGGSMKLHVLSGKNHDLSPEYFQCRPLLDFLVQHLAKGAVSKR